MSNRYGYSVLTDEDRKEILKHVLSPPKRIVNPVDVSEPSILVSNDIFSPKNFDEYVGQEQQKALVSIMIRAAKEEKRPLPNILIVGSFGLGKTSLARIILKEYNNTQFMVDGTSVNKNPLRAGITIIDEIHNLDPQTCDSLNLLLDRGTHHIIGCTTDPGQIPAAFRSRFHTIQLDNYSVANLATIAEFALKRKKVTADKSVLEYIAKRSRFNARVLINNLSMILDLMTVQKKGMSIEVVKEAFNMLGIDNNGFLLRDRLYVKALPDRPVGLSYLSAVLNIDRNTLENEVEPYLMQCGIIDRTPKGRVKIKDI